MIIVVIDIIIIFLSLLLLLLFVVIIVDICINIAYIQDSLVSIIVDVFCLNNCHSFYFLHIYFGLP